MSLSINATQCTRCLRVFCELCKDDPAKVNVSYKSKRGLSGHQRQPHPATYHSTNVPDPKKKRWDDEELVVMAQNELEAPPGTKFINLYLVTKFPGTTNTQLASLRKTKRYQNILDSVAQDQATRSDLHAQNNEQSGDLDTATELINIQAAPEAPNSNAHNNEQGGYPDTTTELINTQFLCPKHWQY